MRERSFAFEQHDLLLFGRARDCHVCLPQDDPTASRYHFLLEVNPPLALVQDLGSLAGTRVNGKKVGGRAAGQMADEVAGQVFGQAELQHGDEIRVGRHVMQVEIEQDEPEEAEEGAQAGDKGPNSHLTEISDTNYDAQR